MTADMRRGVVWGLLVAAPLYALGVLIGRMVSTVAEVCS